MMMMMKKDNRLKQLSIHGELPKILEFQFNIFATAEASDFKFGTHFGFSKTHHKITPRGKSGRGPGLGELLKIWGSLLIFLKKLKIKLK